MAIYPSLRWHHFSASTADELPAIIYVHLPLPLLKLWYTRHRQVNLVSPVCSFKTATRTVTLSRWLSNRLYSSAALGIVMEDHSAVLLRVPFFICFFFLLLRLPFACSSQCSLSVCITHRWMSAFCGGWCCCSLSEQLARNIEFPLQSQLECMLSSAWWWPLPTGHNS